MEFQKPELHHLTDHFVWGKADPHGIIYVEVRKNNRETIDAWMDFSEKIRHDYPADKPLLILANTSMTDFAFSPYTMKRGRTMMEIRPELYTNIAWVLRPTFLGQLLTTVLRSANRGNAAFHITHELNEGVEWLHQRYEKLIPTLQNEPGPPAET